MSLNGKQLLQNSTIFAQEHRATSWWCLLSTLVIYGIFVTVAMINVSYWIRIPCSIMAGLVLVRLFIVYHDWAHGTVLKKSPVATVIMSIYGIMSLNPPSIWKRSHDHHHKHNAKLFGAAIGSFPVMTTKVYAEATRGQRFVYALTRHPLTILLGYLTVFLFGMCIRSLLAKPKAHIDSAVALVVHVVLIVLLASFGLDVLLLGMMLPAVIAAASGAYLFYAQHNFPTVRLKAAGEWNYVTAALESSSYIKMNPLLAWITGNIGYHHLHHLNHHIPFYRLPEAMAGLPEMQSPEITTLHPRDILACLRLKLWDQDAGKLVPFPKSESGARAIPKANANSIATPPVTPPLTPTDSPSIVEPAGSST